MEKIWYHGTNLSSAIDIYEKGIDFSKSKDKLDFGVGFYLTDDIDRAYERAWQKTLMFNRKYKSNESAALVEAELDIDFINTLNVKKFEYCNKEWLYFVLANRFSKDYIQSQKWLEHNLDLRYDVVIGSIADSEVSDLAMHIMNNDMSISDVSVYDVLTNEGRTLGEQLSLHTEKSKKCIKTLNYSAIERRKLQ